MNCKDLVLRLSASKDIKEIHSLSLEISDRLCLEGLHEIMIKIRDESTLNYRGTLLYACSTFDCTIYFSTIIKTLISGGYEASIEAYNLLIENVDYKNVNQLDISMAIRDLKRFQGDSRLENVEIIQAALELLDND